ncbi:MAG: hypothetical protein R6X34_29345 [Chloroflexota bacterium]
MFGKSKTQNPEEDTGVVVDTVPRPEAETVASPPPPKAVKSPPPLAAEPPPSAVPAPIDDSPTDTELARLRDILFGGQTRSTEKRINDLELRLETVQQELNELIERRVSSLDKSAGNQLAATRTDFVERLNMKTETQSQNLRAVQQELTDRLEKENIDLTTQIRSTQRDLSARLDSQQLVPQLSNFEG